MTERKPFLEMPPVEESTTDCGATFRSFDCDDVREMREKYEALCHNFKERAEKAEAELAERRKCDEDVRGVSEAAAAWALGESYRASRRLLDQPWLKEGGE